MTIEEALEGVAIRRRRFRAGEVLFHQGDPGESAQLVLSGLVGMEASGRHRDPLIARILRKGEVAAVERLLLPGTHHEMTARAITACEVRLIRASDFAGGDVDDQVRGKLAAEVTRQSQELVGRVVEMAHLPASARVANAIRRLAGETGLVTVSQDVVAAFAGVARVTANAELRALQSAGVITVARCRVQVVDSARLEQMCR